MASLQSAFEAAGITIENDEILSWHPEIASIFLDASQLYLLEPYRPEEGSPRSWNSVVVVKTKFDLYNLLNNNESRQDLKTLVGIEEELWTEQELQVPPPTSQLWECFDAVRLVGYDKLSAKRSVTLIAMDYFSEAKVLLNTLSCEDERVYKESLPRFTAPINENRVKRATLLPNKLYILHEQWVFPADEKLGDPSVSFGYTANLILSSACLYGRDRFGVEIKRRFLLQYAMMAGRTAISETLAKTEGFSTPYVEWLKKEFAKSYNEATFRW
ncbi:hypothetical protein F5Y13DRAFT_195421 [Hypoxylon sp. FL1857]|nr:hypothetical protein F5Y13DRAFT_195421 [Hypoxylon sp. FL1857]